MKTQLYFVRHGKVKNPQDIWYGRLPRFGLDELGISQLEKTANFFKDQNINVIYSSPLLRAKQSAKILQKKLKSPLKISKHLLEIESSMEGKPFSFVESIEYDVFASKEKQIKGETLEQVLKRMQKFIQKAVKFHKGKKIIAVSHGDPIMSVKAFVAKLPIENKSLRPGKEYYIQHGEAYMVEIEDEKIIGIKSVFNPANG